MSFPVHIFYIVLKIQLEIGYLSFFCEHFAFINLYGQDENTYRLAVSYGQQYPTGKLQQAGIEWMGLVCLSPAHTISVSLYVM